MMKDENENEKKKAEEKANWDEKRIEAEKDIKKSYRHALTDVYVEVSKKGDERTLRENMIHAERRLAAIRVKSYEATEKASKKMICLTRSIWFFTLVLVVVGILGFGDRRGWFSGSSEIKNEETETKRQETRTENPYLEVKKWPDITIPSIGGATFSITGDRKGSVQLIMI